jgi:hypothetical protein
MQRRTFAVKVVSWPPYCTPAPHPAAAAPQPHTVVEATFESSVHVAST